MERGRLPGLDDAPAPRRPVRRLGCLLAAGLVLPAIGIGTASSQTLPAATCTVAPGAAEVVAALAAPPTPASGRANPGAATPVADQGGRDGALAAVANFVACWNAGDLAALGNLVTPRFGAVLAGDGAPVATAETPRLTGPLPPMTPLAAGEVNSYADGRFSVEVEYKLGAYQVGHSRFFLLPAAGLLLLDNEQPLPSRPPGDTTVIGFALADDEAPLVFDGGAEIVAAPVVILQGANFGGQYHLVTLTRLADDAASPPIPGEFVGQARLPPGERQEMVLSGLPPGRYLLTDAAVADSAAVLTVSEPAV